MDPDLEGRPTGRTRPDMRLRRVIAVGQAVADVDGAPLILTSVELWSDRVDLHLVGLPSAARSERIDRHSEAVTAWHRGGRVGSAPPPADDGLSTLDVVLRDDLGTRYHMMAGGSGAGRAEWQVHRQYAPGVPDGATRLTVELPTGSLDLVL